MIRPQQLLPNLKRPTQRFVYLLVLLRQQIVPPQQMQSLRYSVVLGPIQLLANAQRPPIQSLHFRIQPFGIERNCQAAENACRPAILRMLRFFQRSPIDLLGLRVLLLYAIHESETVQ